jgi:hypothetical protein
MSNIALQRNIGAFVDCVRASAASAATAGGSGDATTTTGTTIDREALSNGSMPDSALFSLIYDATLASGKTLSVSYSVQDSADGSTFADYQTPAASVIVATGASGGGVVAGQFNVQANLRSARRYVRFNSFPDLSNTATDTAVTRAVAVLGGFDRLPSPN